jgi:glycosyltransferase involved in cell wall biosynthesis
MSTAGRLSVAMCTYEGARFLPDQLESLASQTRLPDELVVCDDRSTDGTVDLLRGFAGRAPFPVRVLVNEERLGSTRNFSRAMGLCRGDLVFPADQDDVWDPTKLERLGAFLAAAPDVGAAFSDAELVGEDLRPRGGRLWSAIGFGPGERRALRAGRWADVLLKHNVVTGATMAFRRPLLALALPVPAGWFHDEWIALVAAAVSRLDFVARPLIRYRQHARNQVGARAVGLGEQLAGAAVDHRALHLAVAARFAAARERLAALPPRGDREDLLRKVGLKVLHQTRRGSMPRGVAIRAAWVARELVTRRYARYSCGLRCALKDLVFGGRGA